MNHGMTNDILLLFILAQCPLFLKPECTSIDTDKPVFSKKMPPAIRIIDGTTYRLDCCMYGVSGIQWAFKLDRREESWQEIGKMGFLSKDNRTLVLKYPLKYSHTGVYRCSGTNERGVKQLMGLTFGSVVMKTTDLSLDMVTWTKTNNKPIVFTVMSTVTLVCVAKIFEESSPQFTWYKVTGETYTTIVQYEQLREVQPRMYTLSQGYTGHSQITMMKYKRHLIIYNFTLTITSLNSSHRGTYSCEIKNGTLWIRKNFLLTMTLYDKESVFYLIGTIGCCVIGALLIHIFQYDIKIFIKNILRIHIFKDCPLKIYHFLFVYNFDDSDEFRTILNVVNYLGSRGHQSYYHHRDQSYGKDTFEDLKTRIKQSNVVVIWANESLFDNHTCTFCIESLINQDHGAKRVYVMRTTQTNLLDRCTSKTVSADIRSTLTPKILILDSLNYIDQSKNNFMVRYNYRSFVSRIICLLPIKSLHKDYTVKYIR